MAFVHTPLSRDAFYTIEDLNQFFSDLADEINSKVGTDDPEVVVNSAYIEVAVGLVDVVVGDNISLLTGSWGLNGKRAINLADGVDDNDAITVAQAKEIANG